MIERTREVFNEFIQVRKELGNIWMVTPGSRFCGHSSEQCIERTLRKALGRPQEAASWPLRPFPFYNPHEWILQKVLEDGRKDGKRWQEILAEKAGVQELADDDLKARRLQLESRLKRPATDEELCIYLQFPRDALEFIKFEERFGQTWLLPPEVWFHEGGFPDGSRITFPDKVGKIHNIDIVSTRRTGESVHTSFLIDYRFQTYTTNVSKNRTK